MDGSSRVTAAPSSSEGYELSTTLDASGSCIRSREKVAARSTHTAKDGSRESQIFNYREGLCPWKAGDEEEQVVEADRPAQAQGGEAGGTEAEVEMWCRFRETYVNGVLVHQEILSCWYQ